MGISLVAQCLGLHFSTAGGLAPILVQGTQILPATDPVAQPPALQKKKKKAVMDQGWCLLGLPRWRSVKESACQCRRHGFNPGLGRSPWKRKWQLTPVFLPGNSMDRGVCGLQSTGSQSRTWQILSTHMCAHTHDVYMCVYIHTCIHIEQNSLILECFLGQHISPWRLVFNGFFDQQLQGTPPILNSVLCSRGCYSHRMQWIFMRN